MMKKNVTMVTVIIAMLLMVMSPSTASAATVVKVASAKGAVCKTTDGSTGYLVAKKALKKGTSLTLKKVSNSSKLAKTYAYGVGKKMSAKKLAKTLKKPKAYKVKAIGGIAIYKAYKGKKLSYILIKKVKTAPKPASPEPKPEPAPAPAVQEQQPGNAGTVESQSQEGVAETIAEGAEVTVVVATSNTDYNSDVYAISGTRVVLRNSEHSVSLDLRGGKYSASDSEYVPNGTYQVSFPRPTQELDNGASPYFYPTNETVTVSGDSVTKDIYLDPVAGQLGVYMSDATAATDPTVKVDGKTVNAPCELNLVAGNHEVSWVCDGMEEKSEDIYVKPGWTDIEL